MDIDITRSHVPGQMPLYRNRIQPSLFSNLSYRISLFIKPLRIFHSRKVIAGIVAQLLLLHLFRRIRNDIMAIRFT